MFTHLDVHNWRQFDRVDVEFHPRLTVLTGANGAGKTTLLHLLNRHWGWNIQYVSTPRFTKRGVRQLWSGFWAREQDEVGSQPTEGELEIGAIGYRDHPPSRLLVPAKSNETFSVNIRPQPGLHGVYVSSHRPLYIHQAVENIPTRVDARQQIFNAYVAEIKNRWAVNQKVRSPSHMLKQSLISLATFGYGTETLDPNPEARETFEGFQAVLRKILPPSLGFQRLRVRVPDVILQTSTGDFAFDAVSGGVSALIDIAWQVFLYSTLAAEFVVVIDEPEAHLHPELQQTVLPNLLDAFPDCQFIVATHNPFVVGSVRDSFVYVLRYSTSNRVDSFRLDNVNKAGSANEILREVLGVRMTTGRWVDRQLDEILTRYSREDLNEESFAQLKAELHDLGLGRFLPETLSRLLGDDAP